HGARHARRSGGGRTLGADAMKRPAVDATAVISLIEGARATDEAGLAFDADGTLWAGDLGEDVFEYSYDNGLLGEAALPELQRVNREQGLPSEGSASELAKTIHEGYRRGLVNELLTCEVMTWAYAGWTADELGDVTRRALAARGLVGRVRRILSPI